MRSVYETKAILLLIQFTTLLMKYSSVNGSEISEIDNNENFLMSDVGDSMRRSLPLKDETDQVDSRRTRAPELLPLSLNHHQQQEQQQQQQQQDVEHLSDLNGSGIVSSLYVGERTTVMPLSQNTMKSSNVSLQALSNYKGTVEESFLRKFNAHWLKFPSQEPSAHYALASFYFVMMLFGITGNALVIFLFLKCPNVRTPANNLILNLAIADFIIMLEAPIFIYNSLHFGPAAGELACKLYGMLGATGGTVAIITLTAISIDRYNVIVYPLNPSRSTTNIRSRLMILFVWVYSLPFCVVPFFELGGVSGYIPEGFLTACSFDYLDTSPSNYWFIFIYATAAFFVPLTVIAYCYVHILYVVVSAKKIQSSKEKNKTEVRLAAVVMGIVGLWFFAWAPYCAVSLLGILGYGENISPLASMIPAITAKSAACIDPYLYAMTHPRFRKEFEKIFCTSRVEGSNFQTSIYSRGTSRRRGRCNESECESIEIGNIKPNYNQAESSFCDNSAEMDEAAPPTKC